MMEQRTISIILPVYNAYDDLVACVDSVIAHTDSGVARLVAINDASTDARIAPYLAGVQAAHPAFVTVVENEQNLGFVKTCNKGMQCTDGDVVLLNSDTEVSAGWIEKLEAAAASDSRTASVTPLSNNATLVSVPVFEKENALPTHLTLGQAAAVVEAVSDKLYPQLPTSMGYCMYMTRRAIDAVGGFDEAHFGRGYGEENDWCYRAAQMGFIHLACDDLYIYHKGKASFGGRRDKAMAGVTEYLTHTYPVERAVQTRFLTVNPLAEIQDNVRDAFRMRNTEKPSVLYVLHNACFHDKNLLRGGAEYHVMELAQSMEETVYVLYPSFHDSRVLMLGRYDDGEYEEMPLMLAMPVEQGVLYSKDLRGALVALLEALPIGLVHIHQWVRLGLDIFEACLDADVPYALTLHDYYAACPRINFIDENGKCCGPDRDCGRCNAGTVFESPRVLQTWRDAMHRYLLAAAKVYAPDECVLEGLAQWWDDLKIHVWEHGVFPYTRTDDARRSDGKFRVAFVGNMQPSKGSTILLEMLEQELPDWMEIYLFGDTFDGRINESLAAKLRICGAYERDTLQGLLQEHAIDLVVLPSIWPETYSYTLTEAMQAGCPVLAADVGAMGNRIKKYGCGYLVPLGSGGAQFLAEIKDIYHNKEAYEAQKSKVRMIEFPSRRQLADRYAEDYARLGRQSMPPLDAAAMKSTLFRMRAYDAERYRRSLARLLQAGVGDLRPSYVSLMYIDYGGGFCEEDTVKAMLPFDSDFRLTFNVDPERTVRALRWDPLEGVDCRVKLTGVLVAGTDGGVRQVEPGTVTHNGELRDGWIEYHTADPMVVIPFEGAAAEVVIEGSFEIGTGGVQAKSVSTSADAAGATGVFGLTPSCLYVDYGQGASEDDKVTVFAEDSARFRLRFDIPQPSGVKCLRFDPMEAQCCVWITSARYGTASNSREVSVDGMSHNGSPMPGGAVFDTADPWFLIPVEGDAAFLEVEGLWVRR